MKRTALGLSTLGLAAFVAFAAPQERVKKKGPPKFADEAKAAIAAFEHQKLAKAYEHWKRAGTGLTMARRAKLREAFPPAGDATVKDDMQFEKGFNNPMVLGMLGATMGNILKRTYRWEGNKQIKVEAHLDSPLGKNWQAMIKMSAANDPNSEMIQYQGGLGAVLKKRGNGAELQMNIAGAMFTIRSTNANDEELLKFWSDEAVQRVNGALTH